MEATAKLSNTRGSARKARLVLDLIRGRKVADALRILALSNKAAARNIKKLLDSAVANAVVKDGKIDADAYVVSRCFADDGPVMKRYRPRAQGRATVVRKRTCSITLAISGKGKHEETADGSKN